MKEIQHERTGDTVAPAMHIFTVNVQLRRRGL